MNRGHLATIDGGQVWVIRDKNYEVVSAIVVYVEPGRNNIRLGQDIVTEPFDHPGASQRPGIQHREEVRGA